MTKFIKTLDQYESKCVNILQCLRMVLDHMVRAERLLITYRGNASSTAKVHFGTHDLSTMDAPVAYNESSIIPIKSLLYRLLSLNKSIKVLRLCMKSQMKKPGESLIVDLLKNNFLEILKKQEFSLDSFAWAKMEHNSLFCRDYEGVRDFYFAIFNNIFSCEIGGKCVVFEKRIYDLLSTTLRFYFRSIFNYEGFDEFSDGMELQEEIEFMPYAAQVVLDS